MLVINLRRSRSQCRSAGSPTGCRIRRSKTVSHRPKTVIRRPRIPTHCWCEVIHCRRPAIVRPRPRIRPSCQRACSDIRRRRRGWARRERPWPQANSGSISELDCLTPLDPTHYVPSLTPPEEQRDARCVGVAKLPLARPSVADPPRATGALAWPAARPARSRSRSARQQRCFETMVRRGGAPRGSGTPGLYLSWCPGQPR